MANVGPMEILVVLLVALIVFGPKRLPELGQSLGKGIREFKASLQGGDRPAEGPEARGSQEVRPTTQGSNAPEDHPSPEHR